MKSVYVVTISHLTEAHSQHFVYFRYDTCYRFETYGSRSNYVSSLWCNKAFDNNNTHNSLINHSFFPKARFLANKNFCVLIETNLCHVTILNPVYINIINSNLTRFYGCNCWFRYWLFVKGPFRSSSQTATCYYQSNRSKVDAIPLSALPKDTTSKLASLSPH